MKSVLEAIFGNVPSALPYFALVLMLGLYCLCDLVLEFQGESDEEQELLRWALKIGFTGLLAMLGVACICFHYRVARSTVDKIRPLTIKETVYPPNLTIKGWIKLEGITTGKMIREKLVDII